MAGINRRKCCCVTCLTGNCSTGCSAGTVPNKWTVTFAGIDYTSWAGLCLANSPISTQLTGITDPNLTLCLSQSFTCRWSYNDGFPASNPMTFKEYVNGSCSGSTSSLARGWQYALVKKSNLWEMSIGAAESGSLYHSRAVAFFATAVVTDPLDCSLPLSFTNVVVGGTTGAALDGSGQRWNYYGGGGSVVLTPCCP